MVWVVGCMVIVAFLVLWGFDWFDTDASSSAKRVQRIKSEEQMTLWQMQAASRQAREAMMRAAQERRDRD